MADPKEILANFALNYIYKYNIIGLGTGKTVRKLIEAISFDSFSNKLFLTSSIDSEILISQKGLNVISLFSGLLPDIYIDSFDSLLHDNKNKNFIMIKGGGGALTREKILAYNAKFRVFIGEETKMVKNPRYVSVPIEVVSPAVSYVIKKMEFFGIRVRIRDGNGKIGPTISDNGNIILDAEIRPDELYSFSEKIREIPGVIETGIFTSNLYDLIILGSDDGRIQIIEEGKASSS
ncbi:ribose 5-phosphate isomerase A [Acidianus sp. DSM 29099]|nr:ribose 5-phosphate isomerase A [Acidianus sp. RZ1]